MTVSPSRTRSPRRRRTPPSITLPIGDLRLALGLTLDDVRMRIAQFLPEEVPPPTRGAISAIEHGHRGASAEMVELLARAYGLPVECLSVDYTPRRKDAA